MRNVIMVGFLAVLVAACSATYKRSDIAAVETRLNRGTAVLIATPVPGKFNDKVFPASGTTTALAVRKAFSRYSGSAMISRDCRDVGCLGRYVTKPDTYLVVPEILRWEDRATTWSGKPDQIEIRVSVYSATSRRKLAESIVYGVSSAWTLMAGTPEELLAGAVGNYVASLY